MVGAEEGGARRRKKIGVMEVERGKAAEPPPKKREAAERCWSRKAKAAAIKRRT